jgi:4-carboxymuconolactone decarboxylase
MSSPFLSSGGNGARRSSGYAHAPLAQKAGLSSQIIAELKANKRPSSMAEDEATVYDFVTELTTQKEVSDATYSRAKKIFNDQQIVDLTSVAGCYVSVAMLAMAEETSRRARKPRSSRVNHKR